MSDPSDDAATNNLRDELRKQIAEGDTTQLTVAVATLLVAEILPALERMERKWEVVENRLWQSEMALAEIHGIYAHLQDLVPGDKSGPIAEARARYRGRLERMTEDFSLEKYLAQKNAQSQETK
jgi:hypothetical protein